MEDTRSIFWTKQSCYIHKCTAAETVWTCQASSSQRELQYGERRRPWNPTHRWGAAVNWKLLRDREPVFFKDVTMVDWSLPMKVMHPWVYRQHKLNLKGLISLHKGLKIWWIGKTTGSERSVWSGMNMVKIYCLKFLEN